MARRRRSDTQFCRRVSLACQAVDEGFLSRWREGRGRRREMVPVYYFAIVLGEGLGVCCVMEGQADVVPLVPTDEKVTADATSQQLATGN
jgi:hypothetical protein